MSYTLYANHKSDISGFVNLIEINSTFFRKKTLMPFQDNVLENSYSFDRAGKKINALIRKESHEL